MDTDTYERLLAERVGHIFRASAALSDHRVDFPWLTNSLGDPFAGVWFVAEYPSLGQVERGGAAPSVETQWAVSRGDRLFREALVGAGFKDGASDSPGGWRCYVTNIIKHAAY